MKLFTLAFFILSTMISFGQTVKPDRSHMDSIAIKSKCYFIAGSGGGFSGQVIKYYFLNDGNVYRTESLTKKDSLIKKLTKKETKTVFKKLKALHLEKIDFNHPGNMTSFIEQHKKGVVSLVKWGDTASKIPEEISSFYKYVIDLVSTH